MAPNRKDEGLPQQLGEIKDLVIEYAKQETIVPAKKLGRYVAFGMAGTVALAAGLGLAFLAGLRAIQTETGRTFAARNSWLPYLICLAGAVVIAALAGLMVVKAATKSKTKTKHRDNLAGQSAKGGQ